MNNIKLYLDTADIKTILKLSKNSDIKGITTNPSLMKKNNIKSYKNFIELLCKKISKPISFEIFADNDKEIYNQALKISKFSKNIYVKIPIVNSKGKSLNKVIKKISNEKIKVNITAVFTYEQFKQAHSAINSSTKSIISIFAGRIADTGREPIKLIKKCARYKKKKNIEILWASTREYLNIFQAKNSNCEIITVTPDIYLKKKLRNYNLKKYSIDTSKMFFDDAKKLNLKI